MLEPIKRHRINKELIRHFPQLAICTVILTFCIKAGINCTRADSHLPSYSSVAWRSGLHWYSVGLQISLNHIAIFIAVIIAWFAIYVMFDNIKTVIDKRTGKSSKMW